MSQDPGSGPPMSERMQSLLSRAAEDQLNEQRQLAGVLAEMHAQLTGLGTRLDALGGSAGEGAGPALAELARDLRESVRLLGERIDGVAGLVQQRGHDLAELRTSVDQLKATLDEQQAGLGGVAAGLSALPAFGERLDVLHSGLGGLHERLRGLEELTAAAQGVVDRAESHEAGLRELRQAFTGVASRAAQLPAREDVEAIVARVGEQNEAMANRLGRIESSLPSLLERLDGLNDALAQQAETLDALAAGGGTTDVPAAGGEGLRGVESSLEALHERLDRIGAAGGDTGAVDRLAERVDELHEQLLGEDGLLAEVRALAGEGGAEIGTEDDDVSLAEVEEMVARAVGDSERRLAEHVDAAVLALAEALLRRRRPAPRLPSTPSGEAATAIVAETAGFADEEPETTGVHDEPVDADEELPGEAPEPEAEPPVAADDDAADVGADGDDASRRRKPWWRPGG